jgi:hypothetical protein
MACLISKSAFQCGQDYSVQKFSEDALSKDVKKFPEQSAIVQILLGLSHLANKNYHHAVLNLINVKLPDSITGDFTEILYPADLSIYICICALISCSRNELKETILKSNNYATLMESSAEASVIIEHFLNGNYLQF